MSEQGDTKRSIGIYGETINLAARMEEAAKAHGVPCVISSEVAAALEDRQGRIRPLAQETIRGVSEPFPICEYRPAAARPQVVFGAEASVAGVSPVS